MSDNNQTRTCPACGLPVDEETMKSATGHLLCLKCTLQGTQEPDFKEIVYSMALGYFMAEKALTDPIEALSRAREFVSQLPYWQDTAFSTPSMESLIGLVSNMNQLQYTEELLEPRDFFISHKHAKELDNKLVEPLVIVLKEYDYRVWYDKDTWGTEAGKVEEWAKRGIDQARHCITVLCQPYFTSDACLYELNLMLTTKDPKHVFPIWWTDIDVPFLKQQEQGETLLNIVSINWNDWQGNINQLVDRVIQLANNAEGLKEYCGVALVANEAHILERLEFLISESISPLEPLSFENESLEMPDLGFNHENNHITALFLKNKGLKEIPAFLNQCKALHTLNLAQNPLIRTPKSLSTSLKKFIIRHYSQLTELEATILFMLECQIGKIIPQVDKIEIRTFGFTVKENHVTGLGLYGQDLISLPETFGQLRNLKELYLSSNQLCSLSESFGNFSNLQRLNLEHNKLRSLPKTLENLTNLNVLMIDHQLESLPLVKKLRRRGCRGSIW